MVTHRSEGVKYNLSDYSLEFLFFIIFLFPNFLVHVLPPRMQHTNSFFRNLPLSKLNYNKYCLLFISSGELQASCLIKIVLESCPDTHFHKSKAKQAFSVTYLVLILIFSQ